MSSIPSLPREPSPRRPLSPLICVCAVLLALVAVAVHLARPQVERLVQEAGREHRFWTGSMYPDLLDQMSEVTRRRMLAELERRVGRVTLTCRPAIAADLARTRAACRRGSVKGRSCAGARTKLHAAVRRARSRLDHCRRIVIVCVVVLGLLVGSLGGLALRAARGRARLVMALGPLLILASLGLDVQRLLAEIGQSESVARGQALVARTLMVLKLPSGAMGRELSLLARQAEELSSLASGPARTFSRALRQCGEAVRQELLHRKSCRRAPVPACLRPGTSRRAVLCPRVVVPLARLQSSLLRPAPGQRAQRWLATWLLMGGGLLVLTALLLVRQPEKALL